MGKTGGNCAQYNIQVFNICLLNLEQLYLCTISRYYISIIARKGISFLSDIAIDDISLSPECFGLNIPPSELNGYNYYNPIELQKANKEPHKDFLNVTSM